MYATHRRPPSRATSAAFSRSFRWVRRNEEDRLPVGFCDDRCQPVPGTSPARDVRVIRNSPEQSHQQDEETSSGPEQQLS